MVFRVVDMHRVATLTHKRCDPSRHQVHELAVDVGFQDY